MMTGLANELEMAEAKVAALKRQIAQAKCIEIGRHNLVQLGGANCGCTFDNGEGGEDAGCCSVPVFTCSVCGDCDYGENAEATLIRQECHDRSNDGQQSEQE
jgi:hypothetical protein